MTVLKWDPKMVLSAIYWEGDKQVYQVKRFNIESAKDPVHFITEHPDSKLAVFSLVPEPSVVVSFDKRSNDRPDEEVVLSEFIAVKV
ncbi:MAG: hypothetical protein R2818_01595 [Flavobacteriales bacterium]